MDDTFELMIAPNGARLKKADHGAIPITPDELATTARECAAVGATSLHLHVRDAAGNHSLNAQLYADAMHAVSQTTNMPIQISTEAAGLFDVSDQISCLRDVPATHASVSLREISRMPDRFGEAYATTQSKGMVVQHILYSPQDVTDLLRHMDQRDIADTSRHVIFVLGRYSENQTSTPDDLKPFLRAAKGNDLSWSTCAFGRHEHDCLLAALDEGGGVRIGFENNTLSSDGVPYPDNATSVAAFVNAAGKAGFQPKQVSK